MARSTTSTAHTGVRNTPKVARLPLRSVNHVTYAVPSPRDTAAFFERTLGFKRLDRPETLIPDGAWICGMGMEIHLILCTDDAYPRQTNSVSMFEPRADHISFLCPYSKEDSSAWRTTLAVLKDAGVPYYQRHIKERDIHEVS